MSSSERWLLWQFRSLVPISPQLAGSADPMSRNCVVGLPVYGAWTTSWAAPLLAEQQQQAGWAAFDHGRHAVANQLYNNSRKAAEDAQALDLAGNALAYSAYQQTATQQNGTVLATNSYEVARQVATPKVNALLLERKAWAHATAGEAAEADRALNLAREALCARDERPEPDWVFWVDAAEIDIMAGRCWTELRRPLRAVPVLERVLADFDDTHARDKALYLTWLATSYLQAHEVDQAAATLGHAADLATGGTSGLSHG